MKTIKAQVHMLPTEDRGYSIAIAFGSEIGGKLYYFGSNSGKHKTDKPQHLYITTDEEIKEGDWYLMNMKHPTQSANGEVEEGNYDNCRKIIATTDPKLSRKRRKSNPIKSVAEIPQSFIEAYCKAGGIDEVLVEMEIYWKKRDGISIKEWNKAVDEARSTHSPNKYLDISHFELKLNPDNTIIISKITEVCKHCGNPL